MHDRVGARVQGASGDLRAPQVTEHGPDAASHDAVREGPLVGDRDVGPEFEQRPYHPAPDETSAAGHQHAGTAWIPHARSIRKSHIVVRLYRYCRYFYQAHLKIAWQEAATSGGCRRETHRVTKRAGRTLRRTSFPPRRQYV